MWTRKQDEIYAQKGFEITTFPCSVIFPRVSLATARLHDLEKETYTYSLWYNRELEKHEMGILDS